MCKLDNYYTFLPKILCLCEHLPTLLFLHIICQYSPSSDIFRKLDAIRRTNCMCNSITELFKALPGLGTKQLLKTENVRLPVGFMQDR